MTDHIYYDPVKGQLRLLDQRLLPSQERFVYCRTYGDAINAIKNMTVRGAPAIGVTAAWACVLALNAMEENADWRPRLAAALTELGEARPTAVNLMWAVGRMRKLMANAPSFSALRELWHTEAQTIQTEDIAICHKIGKEGESVIQNGDTILTHCNAGALATAGYGTALGVIRAAREAGKDIRVIADETRPLLQGARLTAYELQRDGIPVTVVCDNACALLMSQGRIQVVITGADRIAANGDTANKIGTYGVAILASHFNVPFYIAAPISTFDSSLKTGADIPLEQRSGLEVIEFNGVRTAPQDVETLNFAFDVTPAALISGIITETGILRQPYTETIKTALASASTNSGRSQ